jgi:succinate dehydrogenase/fumarate reductase-like Fe-S protein
MKVDIRKSDGLYSYEIPASAEVYTVMQALDYIYRRLDHSLAYFKHSACRQGICGRCLVKVNGKNVLSCTAKFDRKAPSLLIEPAGKNIIRDLVIKGA